MVATTPELIDSIANLLSPFIWPAVLLFIIVKFRSNIGDFVKNLHEFTLRAPGIEASARRREIKAAAALGAAVARPGKDEPDDPSILADAVASALPDARAQRLLAGSLVLWVDDRPDNNIYERQAMEALGVRFILALSTEEALTFLRRQSFDMIISDMGRPPDPRAGYTLLDDLRRSGNITPFFIYAGSRSPEHIREARSHGAIGCTNSARELISAVTAIITAAKR